MTVYNAASESIVQQRTYSVGLTSSVIWSNFRLS